MKPFKARSAISEEARRSKPSARAIGPYIYLAINGLLPLAAAEALFRGMSLIWLAPALAIWVVGARRVVSTMTPRLKMVPGQIVRFYDPRGEVLVAQVVLSEYHQSLSGGLTITLVGMEQMLQDSRIHSRSRK